MMALLLVMFMFFLSMFMFFLSLLLVMALLLLVVMVFFQGNYQLNLSHNQLAIEVLTFMFSLFVVLVMLVVF